MRTILFMPGITPGDELVINDGLTDRWSVIVTYKDPSAKPVTFSINELVELQDIIERGPDFGTIDKIEITYNLDN